MVPIHPGTMVLCVGSSERGIRGQGDYGLWRGDYGLWRARRRLDQGWGCTTRRVVRDERQV